MLDKTQQTSLDQYFDDDEDFSFESKEKKKTAVKEEKKDDDDDVEGKDKSKKKKEEDDDVDLEDEDVFEDFTNPSKDQDDKDEEPDDTGKTRSIVKKKDEAVGKKKDEKDQKEVDKDRDRDKDNDDDEEETDVQFFTNLTKQLKKKGIFASIDIKEDDEVDQDRFFELQDEELDARLDEEIETLFKGINPDAAEHIKHLKNGGRTQDFLRVYGQPTFKEDLDLTSEKNRKAVITTYLREIEGLDEEEVEERLEFLKDGAKMEKYAKRYHTWFVEKEKEDKANLQSRTLKAKQRAIDDAKKFKTDIETFVTENEEAFGIPIQQKDRKKLIAFITDASVKTQAGFRTNFQIKLDALYKSDEKLVAFANLLMNDFKMDGVKAKGKTEKVENIREILRTGKDSRKVLSSAQTRTRSTSGTIADLL